MLSRRPLLEKTSPHGFALAIVMVIIISMTIGIGALIYFTQRDSAEDAQRLLLLQASDAAKSLLAYEVAWIEENGISKISPGKKEIPSAWATMLNNIMPFIQTTQCEIYISNESPTERIYIDPSIPANFNNPFMAQSLPQSTYNVCIKIVAQASGNGPSITLYAALPIIKTSFPYNTCAVFLDMDADYFFSSNGGYFYLNGMVYNNGYLWSTCWAHFKNLILTTKGFRQMEPALFTNASDIDVLNTSLSWKKFFLSGATAFMGTNNQNYFNCIYGGSEYGGASYYYENDYYDSLTTNAKTYNQEAPFKTWNEYIANYTIWYSSGTKPFSIPGFRNYRPSNPLVASNASNRSSYNYAWALLEPPLSSQSTWNKGEGENYKFSKSACAILRLDSYPLSNIDSSWGLPSMPSPASPICSSSFSGSGTGNADKTSSVALYPIVTPTSYDLSFLSFKKSGDAIQTDSHGNAILENFGGHSTISSSAKTIGTTGSLTLNQGNFQGNFAVIAPYKIENGTTLSSFYDPRRKAGVDAVMIDVEALYKILRNGSSTFPNYQPSSDYTGIVYIWFPDSIFNPMPNGDVGGDGVITPPVDSSYIRIENGNTDVVWGVVLCNGGNIPYSDDPAGGFTIASNVPIYIWDNYGSNAWPCMVAADAVTLLSKTYFQKSSYYSSLLYSNYLKPEDNYVNDATIINSSIMSGVTTYWLTGDWSGAGDTVCNIPRTIENWSGSYNDSSGKVTQASGSLTLRGTIFGLTEPEIARGPLSNCTNYNPSGNYNPSSINPKNDITPPSPPGCSFLSSTHYDWGYFNFITEDQYNILTGASN